MPRARTPGGTTPSRSSPATSCSPAPRTSWPTSARTPSGSRPGRSSGWSPGRSARPSGPAPGDDPVEHYLSVLADKTGSLIATSARFGAMLAGADEATVDVLARFGERIGVAFQLSDDLLDVLSESTDSGKTPGTDLREGIPTLPVLLMRRDRPPRRRPAARAAGRRPGRRRATTPRRSPCCAPTRRWRPRRTRSAAGPMRPATASPRCPTTGQGGARRALRPGRRPHQPSAAGWPTRSLGRRERAGRRRRRCARGRAPCR